MVEAYRRKLEAKPDLYGKVRITAFGPASGPVAPAGSADVVLFLRNLHDWMAGGFADAVAIGSAALIAIGDHPLGQHPLGHREANLRQ